MTDETRRLLEEALRLAPRERAKLAAELIASVNALADAEAAWTALLNERARRVLAQELGSTTHLHKAPRNTVCFEIDAEVDLERAASFYENEGKTDAFLAEVRELLDRIADNPAGFGFHAGLPRTMGVRRAYLTGFPCALAFVRVRGSQLRVLGVMHEYHSPAAGEISIATLIKVEEWLTECGVRAPAVSNPIFPMAE